MYARNATMQIGLRTAQQIHSPPKTNCESSSKVRKLYYNRFNSRTSDSRQTCIPLKATQCQHINKIEYNRKPSCKVDSLDTSGK